MDVQRSWGIRELGGTRIRNDTGKEQWIIGAKGGQRKGA